MKLESNPAHVIYRDITGSPISKDFHEIMVQIRCWGQPIRLSHNRERASTILEIAQYGRYSEDVCGRNGKNLPDNAVGILDGHPIKIMASFERFNVHTYSHTLPGDAYVIKASESGFMFDMYVFLIENRRLYKTGKRWDTIVSSSMKSIFIPDLET